MDGTAEDSECVGTDESSFHYAALEGVLVTSNGGCNGTRMVVL